jgi:hypothetical protein
MQNVIMQNVIMHNVIMHNVIMHNVIMLNVKMLNVIMQNVAILNVTTLNVIMLVRWLHSGRLLASSSQGQGFESSRCCWVGESESSEKKVKQNTIVNCPVV